MARRPEFSERRIVASFRRRWWHDRPPEDRRCLAPTPGRGRYFTIPQALEAYPGVLTERLIRRLVAERRIAYTYAGRRIVLAEADIEAYLEANRHEPVLPRRAGRVRPA